MFIGADDIAKDNRSSDDRRKMHRSGRNLSGAEQAVLHPKSGKGERDIFSGGRNQQIGRRGIIKGFGVPGRAGRSFDELINVETDRDQKSVLQLCSDIRRYIAQSRENPCR